MYLLNIEDSYKKNVRIIYGKNNCTNVLKKINILPLIVLVAFGSMALYNGLTSTCSISILLENYLN